MVTEFVVAVKMMGVVISESELSHGVWIELGHRFLGTQQPPNDCLQITILDFRIVR